MSNFITGSLTYNACKKFLSGVSSVIFAYAHRIGDLLIGKELDCHLTYSSFRRRSLYIIFNIVFTVLDACLIPINQFWVIDLAVTKLTTGSITL
jgi:hypothetical protein